MTIESKKIRTRIFTLVLLTIPFACAPAPRLYLHYGKEFRQSDLEKILAESPLGTTENIRLTTLGQGQGVSHHVVQVRDREAPHLHKLHETGSKRGQA